MKRGTLVTLGILLALLLVWFVVSDDPQQFQKAPLTVEKVENLSRIEITPPAGGGSEESDKGEGGDKAEAAGDRPELIALEKRDGEWWLTQPVEAPVAEGVAGAIDEQLAATIETDALDIQGDDPRSYGLDEPSAVGVALFGGDADSPAHELMVGEQIEVDGTGAKRTFIQTPDEERIYRAQAEIGELVRKSVGEYRSNQVVDLKKEALTRLEWKHADGPTIVLERDAKGKDWTMSRPQVDWDLDTGAIDSIVGALSDLTADDFADDKTLGAIGLEPPTVRLKAETKEGTTELLVGRVEGDKKPAYYVKLADKRFKYKISNYAGKKLIATLTDLRSKTPRTFDKEALTEVRFPGKDRVVVRKQEGKWTLVRPEADKSLNTSKLGSNLSTVSSLTVNGFPEVSISQAGLGAGADRLAFETKDDDFMILLGDTVDGGSGERYVKFGDAEEIYTVTKRTADKLAPAVDDIVGKSKPRGGRKGMPPGLGAKGGPGGGPGGMNKMQKMKMMRKLKQKMGRGR